ncbi:MAG: hypothetical protein ACREVL_06550 [Solimonas sp.]
MSHNASDRTLGLISIWQVLRKLYWEIDLLRAIPEKIRLGVPPVDVLHVQDAKIYAAVNACSAGLALVDWLYHTVREDLSLKKKVSEVLSGVDLTSDKAFLKSLRTLNKSINACHQICNAYKHFYLHAPDQQFKVMTGEIFTRHVTGEVDIAVVFHVMNNGSNIEDRGSLEVLLKDLADWWERSLEKIGIPDRGMFFPAPSASGMK